MLINPSKSWREATVKVNPVRGEKTALYFRFRGEGAMDFMSFTLEKSGDETDPLLKHADETLERNTATEFYYCRKPEEENEERN